jgi:hypothetical protein
MNKTLTEKIYGIVDSFLVEAKDQNGNERSLERLNQDRHLATQSLLTLFQEEMEEERKEIAKKIDITFANLDSNLTKRDYLELSFLKDLLLSPKPLLNSETK